MKGCSSVALSPYSWDKLVHFSLDIFALARGCWASHGCRPTVGSRSPCNAKACHRTPSAFCSCRLFAGFMTKGRQLENNHLTCYAGKKTGAGMGGLVHGLMPVVPLPLCRLGFAVATHTTSQGEKGDWNKKARAYCQGPDGNACIDLFRLHALQRSRRSCGWSRGPLGFIPGIFSSLWFLFRICKYIAWI